MGTSYTLRFYASDELSETQTLELFKQVEEELALVNRQMSTYDPESELSRFNAQGKSEWFEVSGDLANVVGLANEVSTKTSGAFDVTVGPLVDLWGFGPDGRPEQVPDAKSVKSALKLVGYEAVESRSSPGGLKKEDPKTRVDLSAIAKGHGVDRVCDLFEAAGIESYFVEIGGEVRTKGGKPDGEPWRVGIQNPTVEQVDAPLRILELEDLALATSGNYRNFYFRDGKFFSHTIDPGTGFPVKHRIVSASVVAEECALADAVATAMMTLGFERGLEVAEKENWAVFLVTLGQDGQMVLAASSEFKKHFPDFDLSSPSLTSKSDQSKAEATPH